MLKKNVVYNILIIAFILLPFLIPKYIFKDKEILKCNKCGYKKLIKDYNFEFVFGIPKLHFKFEDNSKCPDGPEHILNKLISSDISANNVIKTKYRLFIVFMGLSLFFYKYIYLKYISGNILKLFKYSRILVFIIYFTIILIFSIICYMILKSKNKSENVLNKSLFSNPEKKQILKTKFDKNNLLNSLSKIFNINPGKTDSTNSTNKLSDKINPDTINAPTAETDMKNMNNKEMNELINKLYEQTDGK